MTRLFRFLIRVYSYALSPLFGQSCRYHPTCSKYADEAFRRHGVLKGLVLSTLRILRCNPWSKHPYSDPVPKQFAWRDLLSYKRSIQKNINNDKI